MVVFIVMACCSCSAQVTATRMHESLAFRCLDKPFISVSVRARDGDTVPAVRFSIADPQGREQGEGVRGAKIPSSSYGDVVQVRTAPQRSKALAVEICKAEQGAYDIKVEERGITPYILDVSGQAPHTDNSDTLLLHHLAQRGRIRRYRFTFRISMLQVIVRWIDPDGNERIVIENNEW